MRRLVPRIHVFAAAHGSPLPSAEGRAKPAPGRGI